MDNGTIDDFFAPPTTLSYRVLGAVGLVALFTNFFILAVFFSSKRLLKSSALFVGLTVGHATNGLVHSMYGFWSSAYEETLVLPLYCIKVIWPNLFITTYQLLPLLLFLGGTERLLALAAPVWYRAHCTHRRLWLITAVTFAYIPISLGVNWLLAWLNSHDQLISASCIPPLVIGSLYMIYGVHIPAVLGGVSATICTAVGVHIGRRKMMKMPSGSKSEMARVKKQVRLAQCLLMISAIDVACVVIPNIVFILFNAGLFMFPMRNTVFVVMVYCSDSILNIVAYILFNPEFRRSSLKLIRFGKDAVTGIDGSIAGRTLN